MKHMRWVTHFKLVID